MGMRLLYVTDLHGHIDKYNRAFEIAKGEKVDAVVNGGDMLPHGRVRMEDQRRFITDFLDGHFSLYDRAGIRYLCLLGNDDVAALDPVFAAVCARHSAVANIAQAAVALGEFACIGMNLVTDFPFRLKDRARMDSRAFAFPAQFGGAVLSTETGFRDLPDWQAYAAGLPTIEEELARLPVPADPRRAMYVIHGPPAGVGLDVCYDGQQVGSPAVHAFLKNRQPLLSLHGHIHESPEKSGVWRAEIGKTICIQPGQRKELVSVLMDPHSMRIERNIG
jgi:Icc-related predicted phosphoesterase